VNFRQIAGNAEVTIAIRRRPAKSSTLERREHGTTAFLNAIAPPHPSQESELTTGFHSK
jgi:hypothetical protein